MMSIATDSPRRPVEAHHSATTLAILQWLHESAGGERRLDYAVSALDWCRRLPKLADMLPATIWQRLLNHLLLTAVEAETPDSDASLLRADPLVYQLLAGELALTLACLFPNIKACRRLLPRARRALSAGLVDLLDGEGLLPAWHFDHLSPLLECWTRCRSLGKRWKRGCWSDEADAQYRRFVRNALRFVRRDGSYVFSTQESRGAARKCKKKPARRRKAELPQAAIHSEWAATAVLQPDWARSAPRLTVLYPRTSCRIELACGKDVLWSGQWGYELRVDGTPVSPVAEWSGSCWVSDEDVDYLELEIELVEGFRIQRHILMARKDRFLLLADAVLGPRRAALDYRTSLPLDRGIAFRPASETNEGTLLGRKARAVAIPLALPEWRDALPSTFAKGAASDLPSPFGRGAGGEGLEKIQNDTELGSRDKALTLALSRRERGQAILQLRQSAFGRSLFAPLFFDLDRRRFGKPLTWRQLTVAESLAVQPADAAVGYRVSVGGKHWLI